LTHAEVLARQRKRKRKFGPVVDLNLPDRERKRIGELAQERETRAVVLSSIQPQHPQARAVIDRCVLKPFRPAPRADLDVDLDRIAGTFFLKELQLLRPAPPRFHEVWHADVAEDALNRFRRDPHVVDAFQPDARTARAELMFEARLRDQRDHLHQSAGAAGPVLRYQPLDAGPLPITPPSLNRGPR
jgi:hypothetical protein